MRPLHVLSLIVAVGWAKEDDSVDTSNDDVANDDGNIETTWRSGRLPPVKFLSTMEPLEDAEGMGDVDPPGSKIELVRRYYKGQGGDLPSDVSAENVRTAQQGPLPPSPPPAEVALPVTRVPNGEDVVVRTMPLAWFKRRYVYCKDTLLPELYGLHEALVRYQEQVDPLRHLVTWEHLQLSKTLIVRLGGMLRFHFHAYVDQWRLLNNRNRLVKSFLRFMAEGKPRCFKPATHAWAQYYLERCRYGAVDIETLYWTLAVWKATLLHYGPLDSWQVVEKAFIVACDLKHFPPFPREREVLRRSWEDRTDILARPPNRDDVEDGWVEEQMGLPAPISDAEPLTIILRRDQL